MALQKMCVSGHEITSVQPSVCRVRNLLGYLKKAVDGKWQLPCQVPAGHLMAAPCPVRGGCAGTEMFSRLGECGARG